MTVRGRVLDRERLPPSPWPTPMDLASRRITDRAWGEQQTRRRALLAEVADLRREQPGQVGVWLRQIERGVARRAARSGTG